MTLPCGILPESMAGVPIATLLGGWRTRLPCYASTYHGDDNGGAEHTGRLRRMLLTAPAKSGTAIRRSRFTAGSARSISREVAAVLAIRDAVGNDMDIMLDPAGAFGTFDDVLKVGRACARHRVLLV